MDFLQVSHLSKYSRETAVLNDINLRFSNFRRLAIAGETGSGKTTLLKAIGGLVQPDAGEIFFEGKKVLGPEEKLLPGHPAIAYLSQHFELRNNYIVGDFLEMASKLDSSEALRIYELCRVAHLLGRKTDQLSGGERQRTALARLLTTSPGLLLLDEPYSNLDSLHKQILKVVVNDIVNEGKTACVMVSHDPADVLPWAEEIVVMKDGAVVQQGRPEQVYYNPADAYTGGLFGDYNFLSGKDAFAVFGCQPPGHTKHLFIRPEKLQLTTGNDGANGTVLAVTFFGSFNEIVVEVSGIKLVVKTSREHLKKGDRVAVSIAQQDPYFL